MRSLVALLIVVAIVMVTYVIPETNGCNGSVNNERRAAQAEQQMRQGK